MYSFKFSLQNAMLYVPFPLCLFTRGVVNALYSADDHRLSPDICATTASKLNHDDKEIRTTILQVKISEGISAVSDINRAGCNNNNNNNK